MKIYQIHEYGGQWEDSYDYIGFTYLSKDKAEIKLKELEEQESLSRMCDNCPLDYCNPDCDGNCNKCNDTEERIKRANAYCGRCDVEKMDKDELDNEYDIRCKNNSGHYDDSSFRLVEVDVIE